MPSVRKKRKENLPLLPADEDFRPEEGIFPEGFLFCGADEAGRGPVAGPVFAAAVILDPSNPVDGLRDSKKLSEKKRDLIAPLIKERSLAWAVASCTPEEIDRLNILQASMLAMKRAIEMLAVKPQYALIDGNRTPSGLSMPSLAVVRGDDKIPAISAASILAKTARDAVMEKLAQTYPEYGFEKHKGYPTAHHLAQLEKYGPSPVHRMSYAPVRNAAEKAGMAVPGGKGGKNTTEKPEDAPGVNLSLF